MPLSEQEQRLLDQIERALYAEDPKFASSVRASDLRSHLRKRVRRSTGLFLLGVVLLLAGVASKVWLVGVLGFVVMLAAALWGLTSWKRVAGRREPARPVGGAASRGRPRRAKTSWIERVEERWRRRWEERGQ